MNPKKKTFFNVRMSGLFTMTVSETQVLGLKWYLGNVSTKQNTVQVNGSTFNIY